MQTCIGKNFEKVLFDFKTCFYTLKTSVWVVLPGHSALLETCHSIVKGIDDDDHCFIIFVTFQKHLTRSGIKVSFINL